MYPFVPKEISDFSDEENNNSSSGNSGNNYSSNYVIKNSNSSDSHGIRKHGIITRVWIFE